jgi:peptidoglycan/LPS O-acetylase OafA/YrhL
MFLNSINFLRAIAIILIVAGHCDGVSGWEANNIAEKFVENLIRGGTDIFMFISGFMFYHIYFHNFDYRGFVRKKISKVLIPYLIMSTPAIIYIIFFKNRGLHNLHGVNEWVTSILFYYMTGNTIDGYWYIPVIMIIFLLSPIFIMFIRLKVGIKIFVLITTFLVSVFIHRPVDNINFVHSVLYFVPFYLLGIFCSIYKKNVYDYQKGLEYIFLAIALLLAWYQSAFISITGNFHKEFFQFNGIDVLLLQKLSLILFLMMWLHRYETSDFIGLSFIAKVSFPIYFLHPYIIKFLIRMKNALNGYDIHTSLLMFVLSTLTVTLLSSFLALFTKRLLRKNSQMLIGW